MDTHATGFRPPDLHSLFSQLEPRNSGHGLGAFGGLPGLAGLLGVEGGGGSGVAGVGGVPGLLDALSLGDGGAPEPSGVLQLFSLQLNVSVTRATGLSLPTDVVLPGDTPQSIEETADNIVNFATGLFDLFAAQNPELSREEAFAEFEGVVRDAIDAGFDDARAILEGLGQLDAGLEERLAALREAINERLDAFFTSDEVEEGGAVGGAGAPAGPLSAEGLSLPTAQSFGITRIEQISLNVSLQVAQARIAARGADATGDDEPLIQPVNFDDDRPFDGAIGDLVALANDLFDRLAAGDDLFGEGGLDALLDRVLDIVQRGFDDAQRIFDDFGASQLNDGTPIDGAFALAYDSVELSISQTRIETADGLVFEQTSISLRVTQIRIQGSIGQNLGGGASPQPIAPQLPVPETPDDVAQNVLDFASGLFGAFRAQNPTLDDDQALADFVALTRDAAAQGAQQARDILEGLAALDDDQEDAIGGVLSRLDELLAERFPDLVLLTD